MKRACLGFFVACLLASAASANPVLRIMPLGDSITEGSGAGSTGGYRGPLWTKLVTEDHYNVDYVGSNTTNPDTTNGMDRDHEGHGGWRIDTTSGGNGIFEMLPTWFSSIESPDVILLHIGTNDSGADTLNTMARTTALLDRLYAMQPSAHVFVSTLMWRNDATRYARIQTYNSNLTNVVAAQVAKGQKISIVDMHAAVPGGDEFGTVNFGDGLHPNTTGYALMAEAWRSAVEELYPDPENFTTTNAPAVVTATVDEATRSTITLRLNTAVTQASATNLANYVLSGGTFASAVLNTSGDSRTITLTLSTPADYGAQTLTVSGLVNAAGNATSSAQTFNLMFPHPQGVENYVPASELGQYKLVYSIDPKGVGANCIDANIYAVDNHMKFGSVGRVAYYVELRKKGGDLQYVWVSMDAFTNNAAFIGIPVRARGKTFQQYVQNLKVWSNVAGVQTGDRGQGFIEFWPNTYGPNNNKGVTGASNSNYDFGDQMTSGNYGCMQVHDVAAKQTIFAFNHWAPHDAASTPSQKAEIGIGNSTLRADSTDWTFSNNGDTYDIRRIQVYALPDAADRTPPAVVSAEYGFSRQKITVTFSEPVAEDNLTSCFTVNGGAVAVRSASRSTADACVVYVTTDVLPDGPVTLSVVGVRDRSPHVNAMTRSEIAVVDRALPADITSKVSSSLTAGFQVVYAFDVPQRGRFINNPAAFFIDESMGTNSFSRVAYFVETSAPSTPNTVNYLWVATDAFTEKLPQIGIPFSSTGAWFQQKLHNTDVASNVSGIQTGTGLETCNIEFWPTDYSQAGKLGLGGNNSNFDFDDTKNGGGSYGCMQIHNYGAKQTLFGMNRWGGNGNFIGFGIGNNSDASKQDWTHADNAGGYALRRVYVLAKEGNPPATFAEVPADIIERVPDAANYELVLDYDLPAKGYMNVAASNLSYRVTDRTALIDKDFARVAYFFELVANNSTTTQYVWTAFDAFTQDATRLVIPTNFTYQQKIDNLDVESNVSGITTGRGIATGNIEMHSADYGKGNKIGIPGANADTYDFGDQMNGVGGVGYGCVQVHNYGAKQTLFAVNNFNKGASVCVGIGNRSSGEPDWTFAGNAGSYSYRRLRIFVSRAKSAPPISLAADVTPRRATASLSRDKVCVSYPAAVQQVLQAPDRYAFADPSIRIVDVSPSAGEPRDVMLTLAEPLGVNTTNALVVSLAPYAADATLSVITRDAAIPAFLANAVPELADYQLLNELQVANTVCYAYPGPNYLVDESRFNSGMRFDRVAYCMELEQTNHWHWACAAMDTYCEDATKLGVPSVERQISHQCYVTNLSVYAGANDGIIPVHTGNWPKGNIEFWPNNYGQGNAKNIPGASGSTFDFGDSVGSTTPASGHGSMQIHNYLEGETILSLVAFGRDGNNTGTRAPGLGIGNNPNNASKGDLDWTFQEGNASKYTVKNIYVFVRPLATGATSLGNGPAIVLQPDPETKRLLGTGDIVLSVYAPDAVSYQWRKDGVPIPNATGRELVITDKVESRGTYDVVAYIDNANYTVSQPARVSVFHKGNVFYLR